MGHRVTEVRHIIRRQVNLWRHRNRGLGSQLGMFVAHYHGWRRDRLHVLLGQFPLGSLEFIAVTTAATTTSLCFRRWQGRNFIRGNQRYGFMGLGDLLHHSASEQRSPNDYSNQQDVDGS